MSYVKGKYLHLYNAIRNFINVCIIEKLILKKPRMKLVFLDTSEKFFHR